MNVKMYTDEKYVPITELRAFGGDFIKDTKKYRRNFIEVIQVDDLHFVNLVETPNLIKKRFIKNIELKGLLQIQVPDNDFILHIAKCIVKGDEVPGLKIPQTKELKELYENNEKDLTIVTNYLTINIDKYLTKSNHDGISKQLPELSKYEISFIDKFNDINHNYTIHDFQDLNKTSYETSRKSLEKLKELSLYSKQKVGKKFIYKPTDKLQQIMKGGA